MSVIKWEDPAPASSGRGSTKWAAILGELRERPGVWALIGEDVSSSAAAAIRAGRLGRSEPGEFDVTMREMKASRGKLYARYRGTSN